MQACLQGEPWKSALTYPCLLCPAASRGNPSASGTSERGKDIFRPLYGIVRKVFPRQFPAKDK